MKKFRTILTAAALCMIFVMAAGCSISQATNIELISYPKTEFLVDEDIRELPFTILVTLNNGNTTQIEFSLAKPGAVQVANFSTENVGSFTAYFTYRSFTYRFDYTVTDGTPSDFAGGSGTEADPYLIANAEQFKNIVLRGNELAESTTMYENGYVYYELIADIDLSGLDVSADAAYREKIELGHFKYPTASEYEFNGSLNGNGHKLMNFKATTDLGIFGTIKNGDFSNLVIDGFNTVGYRVGAFGNGPYSTDNSARASFTNVTINENCRMGFGGYIFQAKGASEVLFTDCVMNGLVYGDGNNVGGFMGDIQCPVTVTNCQMNGSVLGFDFVGAYFGYVGTTSITLSNSTANGTAKYLLGSTNVVGENKFNQAEKTGADLGLALADNKITWNAVEGASYYRVVFGGVYLHFIKTAENVYNLHFVGGYITPIEVSDKITGTEYTGKIYTAFATEGGIEGNTFTNNTQDAKYNDLLPKTDLQAWLNGGNGDPAKTWLVKPANDTGSSILLAKGQELTIYVFAYDADGIIIAGGQVA